MIEDLVKDLFEDFDIFGYIKAGTYVDVYDPIAKAVAEKLSKDISISQIQNIIWEACYDICCVCTLGNTNDPWVLDRQQAMAILGNPNRFENLANTIRQFIDY